MALTLSIETDPVPLRADEEGAVRVGGTRVTLDTLISVFEGGASAEEIASKFPSLRLADVYATIGYYLRHRKEVEDYLRHREAEADRIRRDIETHLPSTELRDRLRRLQWQA